MASHHSLAHRRPRAVATALIAVAALLASCTGGIPPSVSTSASGTASATTSHGGSTGAGGRPSATATDLPASAEDDLPKLEPVEEPEWTPETRSDELILKLGAVGPDRQVPTQLAIDIFSAGVAPLPGATESTLPNGDGLGEIALRLIMAAYDRLSPAQRAVVDRSVSTDADIEAHARISADGRIEIPLSLGPGRALRGAPAPLEPRHARYVVLLAQTIKDWQTYRPEIPGSVITLQFSKKPFDDAAMTAFPNPKDPTACDIVVYPKFEQGDVSDQVVKTYFAHELFHCAQFTWTNNIPRVLPLWLEEGSADFASYDLYRSQFAPPSKGLGSVTKVVGASDR